MGAKKEVKALMKSATPEQKAFIKQSVSAIADRQQKQAAKLAICQRLGLKASAPAPTATDRNGNPVPDAVAVSQMTPKQIWKDLMQRNRYLASAYYNQNTRKIDDDMS